uniref:BPL/LPL catalytic domain-containing protein n=1 Tax=Ditylenchus dipsaci TaxID=166011 RepID=A0A915CPE7_9BILA
MLLWSNTPAVVIGRHQNPWIEADLKYFYHDLGNLNVSFLTTQRKHNRSKNLDFLSQCLNKGLGISSVVPNERDDLILQPSGCKVSGTAARISKGRAYHHLTVLVQVALDALKASLHSSLKDKIESNATLSSPAKSVGYLGQKASSTSVDDVQAMVIRDFQSQFDHCQTIEWTPSELDKDKYVGLYEMLRVLNSEEWIYGRTPRFELSIFATNIDDFFKVVVENGRIKESLHPQFPVGTNFRKSLAASKFY